MRINNNKNQSQPILQIKLAFDRSAHIGKLSIRYAYLSVKITYRLIALIFLAAIKLNM